MGRNLFVLMLALLLNSLEAASQADLKAKPDSSIQILKRLPLPQKFYNKPAFTGLNPVKTSQGYFCKKELEIQKITRLPLFIRLGSKDYVDRIEGKKSFFMK